MTRIIGNAEEGGGAPIGRAVREPSPDHAPMILGSHDVDRPSLEVQDGDGPRRVALAASLLLHAAVLGAMLIRVQSPPPPIPPGAMEVTYITVPGDPPSGDPKGDEAPARTSPSDVEPEPTVDKVEPVENVPTDTPVPDPEPKPIQPPVDESRPRPEAAQPGAVSDPARPGSGTLAMGARTHGNAQGLDPSLIASVSQALATRIRACWEQPVGRAPNDVASSIIVGYAQDGTIIGEPRVVHLVDEKEVPVTNPNEWEVQAVEAAKRCSPMQLPKVLYPYWREVEIQVYSVR
jgi:hypothetical protein